MKEVTRDEFFSAVYHKDAEVSSRYDRVKQIMITSFRMRSFGKLIGVTESNPNTGSRKYYLP